MTCTSSEGYTADLVVTIYETRVSENPLDMSCAPDHDGPHVYRSAFIEVTAMNTTPDGMSWPNDSTIPLTTSIGRGSGDLEQYTYCTIAGDEAFVSVSDGLPAPAERAIGIAAPITPNSPDGEFEEDPEDM